MHTAKLYGFTKKALSITSHFMSLQCKMNSGLNRAQEMNHLGLIHSARYNARKKIRLGNGVFQDQLLSIKVPLL
jgi:hypothetical protein